MTHGDLKALFKLWWQKQHPKGRIFENSSGFAKHGKAFVPYGFPPPIHGKKKSGGGPDLIACLGDGITEFYEIKTLDDSVRPNQKKTAEMLTRLGYRYFVVKEKPPGKGELWEIIDHIPFCK